VRNLPGVTGISNLIAVRPSISPTRLRAAIESALKRSAETDARRIKVEVRGSKVILRGRVRSWAEKQEAERAAWSAPGVTEVDNQILVRRPQPTWRLVAAASAVLSLFFVAMAWPRLTGPDPSSVPPRIIMPRETDTRPDAPVLVPGPDDPVNQRSGYRTAK
jgi:hypothetical protein